MKFSFDLDASLVGLAESEILAAERAVTGGVREIGTMVKNSWRSQVVGSGLGQRLANTIRQNNYPPRGESIGAASLVYVRPNRKADSASAADVVDAFERGVVITAFRRRFLAIPTNEAGRVAGMGGRTESKWKRRLTPERWEQRTGMNLRFVARRGKFPLLVADDARVSAKGEARKKGGRRRKDGMLIGAQTVVIFTLVPQVNLRKRLNLDDAAKAADARLPQAVLSRWR